MLENPEKIGISPLHSLDAIQGGGEGNLLERLDYVFFSKFGVDFTTLPMPRVMGLLRQLRLESETVGNKGKGIPGGGM